MADRQYVFTVTRFRCLCVYRTVGDTAVFCPQHRAPIVENETFHTHTPETPDIPGLVMHLPANNTPVTLRNHTRNSIHTMVSTLDGEGNKWDDAQEEYVGICAACLIEGDESQETRIAMCECGDDKCSYRWCGDTTGLHAYWRIHALKQSQETTGIPEGDIFSYGTMQEQNEDISLALEAERTSLQQTIDALMQNMAAVRQLHENAVTDEPNHSIYLIPWLNQDYENMHQGEARQSSIARRNLMRKITRLHIIGAIPAPTVQATTNVVC